MNVAVYVVGEAGPVTLCDAAPPSDQLAKTYCDPVVPACDAAATVWPVAVVHVNEHGAVHVLPSTVSVNPAGALVTVTGVVPAVNPAVTLTGPDIVTFCGVVVPVSPPVNPVN